MKKFNLFQEEVNQTRENKTKIFHKIVKISLKKQQQVDLCILQKSICTSIRTLILLFIYELV